LDGTSTSISLDPLDYPLNSRARLVGLAGRGMWLAERAMINGRRCLRGSPAETDETEPSRPKNTKLGRIGSHPPSFGLNPVYLYSVWSLENEAAHLTGRYS
jgi:hypothetical protein